MFRIPTVFIASPRTPLRLIGHGRCCVTWTKDEFAVANICRQLQDRHRPPESAADGDRAPAAAAGECEGQAAEGFPQVVEAGGFQRAGDPPLYLSM